MHTGGSGKVEDAGLLDIKLFKGIEMKTSYYLARVISGAILVGAIFSPKDAFANWSCSWDGTTLNCVDTWDPLPPPGTYPGNPGDPGDSGDGGGGGGGGSSPPPSQAPGESVSNPIRLTNVMLYCGQQSVPDTVAVSVNYRSIYGLNGPGDCSLDAERMGKYFEVRFFNQQTGVISHGVYRRTNAQCMDQDIMTVAAAPNCSALPPGTWIP